MDLETALTLSIAAVGALMAALTFWTNAREVGRSRADLSTDVETLKKLDKNSDAHRKLAAHIETRLDRLIERETGVRRRDISSIRIGGGCSVVLSGILWPIYGAGGWWRLFYVPVGFLLTTCLFGLITGLQIDYRDENGDTAATAERKRAKAAQRAEES